MLKYVKKEKIIAWFILKDKFDKIATYQCEMFPNYREQLSALYRTESGE